MLGQTQPTWAKYIPINRPSLPRHSQVQVKSKALICPALMSKKARQNSLWNFYLVLRLSQLWREVILVNQGLAYNPSNALLYTFFQNTHSLSGSLYLGYVQREFIYVGYVCKMFSLKLVQAQAYGSFVFICCSKMV